MRHLLLLLLLAAAPLASAETPAFRRVQHIGGLLPDQDAPIISGFDMNGDGRPDLLVSRNPLADTVPHGPALFLSQGDGRFVTQELPFWQQEFYLQGYAAGDFDNDGRADLVFIESQRKLRRLLGLGGGRFRNMETITTPESAFNRIPRVAVGQIDGANGTDVVALDGYGGGGMKPTSALIAYGTTAGTTASQARVPTVTNAWRLAVADVSAATGAGKAEILTASAAGEFGVTVHEAGTGLRMLPVLRFATPDPQSPDFGANPGDIGVGDLDGDGKLDVVVHYFKEGGTYLQLLLNRDAPSVFALDKLLPLGNCSAGYSASVRIGDYNGDGIADILVNCSSKPFAILFGRSPPGCHCELLFDAPSLMADGPGGLGLTRGDYNGDGKPDIAVATYSGVDIYLYDPAYDRLFADGFQ